MGWWWIVPLILVVACLGVLVLVGCRLRGRGVSVQRARALFLMQREHLEADFLRAAAATRKPRGLRWKNCEWDREVALARNRQTGELTALVGVTVQFEAIEGSDMEGLPAVGNLRNASGVFYFQRGRWRTGGRAVFNLNPAEAIEHFKQRYERVEAG